jgi:hypothetical protein
MHPFPIAARFHQTSALQMSEVTGHFGLYHAQCIGQFADTRFSVCQQIKQAQPRWIGQRFEKECRLAFFGHLHFFSQKHIRIDVYVKPRMNFS